MVNVVFKGISPKIVKEGEDYETYYALNFSVVFDDFNEAVKGKQTVENKLENLLTGQKTLEEAKKKEKE